MDKIKFTFLILFMITGCSKYPWKQPIHRQAELPLVFDKTHVIGSGLKILDLGFLAMPCLKSFETNISGGTTHIEFKRIEKPYRESEPELDHFIKSSIERSNQYKQGEYEPVSFVLIIKVKDRIASIREETIKLRDDVKSLVDGGEKERFFRTCGTEFIHSARFDSGAFLFFTFYPRTSEFEKQLETTVERKITLNSNNVLQLRLFEDLVTDADTYFSLKVETDNLFEPVEFAFDGIHGKKIDDFLKKVMNSLLRSSSGKTRQFFLSSWSKLNDLRANGSFGADSEFSDYSDELVNKALQLLESSMKQFRLKVAQAKTLMNEGLFASIKPEFVDCYTLLEDAAVAINWNAYYQCRATAIFNRTVDLQSLPECEGITKAISDINLSKACLDDTTAEFEDQPFLSQDTYLPIELTDRLVSDDFSIYRQETAYRFKDETQLEEVPEQVTLGQGIDRAGNFYDKNCIREKSKHFLGEKEKRTTVVTNDYFPFEIREWPFIKKLLNFGEQSPQWMIYRGALEIQGYSPLLNPDFELSKFAEELAASNIVEFYRACGTHYVDRVLHRRGFVYYFSPDEAGKEDIDVIPFGLALSPSIPASDEMLEDIPLIGGNPYRVCHLEFGLSWLLPLLASPTGNTFWGLLAGLECYDNLPEVIAPKTNEEFFKDKEKIIMLFKNDAEAIPARLSLFPWSEYLVNKGILKPHQLDLVDLVE